MNNNTKSKARSPSRIRVLLLSLLILLVAIGVAWRLIRTAPRPAVRPPQERAALVEAAPLVRGRRGSDHRGHGHGHTGPPGQSPVPGLRAPDGIEVPLYEIARVDRGRAYTSIDRKNGRRTITVSANVNPAAEAERIMGEATQTILPGLMRKYPGLSWGFAGRQADFRESTASLKWGFLVALLIIYVMLAIPFRNYSQPLIVMTAIPFGIIGAVIGHLLSRLFSRSRREAPEEMNSTTTFSSGGETTDR